MTPRYPRRSRALGVAEARARAVVPGGGRARGGGAMHPPRPRWAARTAAPLERARRRRIQM
eukprot:scaffold3118_cov128-Isochrysis_galbana.AAC.1